MIGLPDSYTIHELFLVFFFNPSVLTLTVSIIISPLASISRFLMPMVFRCSIVGDVIPQLADCPWKSHLVMDIV